jgi:hypothetical protein
MSLADLLKRGSLREFATATVATVATHGPFYPSTVARVATVAVAKAPASKVEGQAPDPAADHPAPDNAVNWHVLDGAYMAHHFNCKTCTAAGRGIRYGLRCGAGAALWALYAATSDSMVTQLQRCDGREQIQ